MSERMATQDALQRLQHRAESAEAILSALRNQLNTIKSAGPSVGGANVCAAEEARLREENNKLRSEVAAMKEKLSLAEVMNGIKQVPLPTFSPATVKAETPKVATPTVNGTQETTMPVEAPVNEKNKQPPKQQKKEKKEGKPKEPQVAAEVDVSRLLLKVGKIVEVMKHPDADGLYVEQVDLGESRNRTIVSGLVPHIPIEEMRDRLAIFCCNLKPAKMRGILSEGMIMCASSPERVEIINTPEGSVPGDRITFDDYPGTPDELLNPKKKIWEKVKPDMKTNADRVATYKGCPFKIEGKGLCISPTAANSQIQ